ncbi:S8 family peptidase [Actinosynnema sp. NPDC047251]|uniref:Extracellular serine proteinase n=1 Tax=Saccharothrix espanaensis (strain ATCC 51144 / DSM 44229 / JCM 9112 / NBRC 15066 / NRRL 15764) TaxID=1179773 RepID=K0JTN3_SACES|nr:S8 family peptidase [Saccharothrix espanaensis]CCH31140.1 Extracellular serine proteinase [Saccharothrix espanaensis DSM 44229]
MRTRSWLAATAVVAGGLVGGAPVATADVLGADAPGAIDGSYVVVLKGERAANDLADRYSATVVTTFSHVFPGFSARMTARDARRLAADPAVSYVQQNQRVRVTGEQRDPPSWGLDRVDQRRLPLDDNYRYPNTASNVTVYVVDTGVRVSHRDFGGRAVWGTNTVDNQNVDCHGHGTHVAGTVGGQSYGVAKNVKLVSAKVFDCGGNGSSEDVAEALDWVVGNHVSGPAVANMSLGGDAPDQVIEDAVRRTIADGVVAVVAAGNESDDACRHSPSRVREALTAAASDWTDRRAYFSNYGTCVDLFAPGDSITSAYNGSDTDSGDLSGTSMATPHVSGAAALLLSVNPALTPAQVATALVNDSTKSVVSDPRGSPNRLLTVNPAYRPGG